MKHDIDWESEKDNIAKLIDEGKSSAKIAEIYGVGGTTIRYHIKKLGLVLSRKATYIKPKKKRFCLNCGNLLIEKSTKYCNISCFHEYHYKTYIEKWKRGEVSGYNDGCCNAISMRIRRYLLDKCNNKCQLCGWGEINPYSGTVPLQIHHIDGNYLNNKEDNLQVLCPNCHSLTENYGNLNTNNGRKFRRKSYKENMQT